MYTKENATMQLVAFPSVDIRKCLTSIAQTVCRRCSNQSFWVGLLLHPFLKSNYLSMKKVKYVPMSSFKILNDNGFKSTIIRRKDGTTVVSDEFIYPNSLEKVGINQEDVLNITYVMNFSGMPLSEMTEEQEGDFEDADKLYYSMPFKMVEGTNKWEQFKY
jgi:hypothetical protein